MAIKDLLIAFDGSETAVGALKYAVQMAHKYDAAITGVHVHPPLVVQERFGRWIGPEIVKSLQEAQDEELRSIRTTFETSLTAAGFTGESEWFSDEGYPSEVLAEVARYYDILLIGQYAGAPDRKRRLRAEDLVMTSGKPIIVVPSGYAVRPFQDYAVVAWDGSSRAARALSDAMQILETEKRLDVVIVGDDHAAGTVPGDRDIVKHLNRHGIDARQVVLPAGSKGVSGTLVAYCEDNSPDMLVMGAYGHARLREDLFGGITKQILRAAPVPILIAH
jgi:nucleotide-binding universal stress UspA family protein